LDQLELERLAEDFFNLAETEVGKMQPEQRAMVVASIHATAESHRATI